MVPSRIASRRHKAAYQSSVPRFAITDTYAASAKGSRWLRFCAGSDGCRRLRARSSLCLRSAAIRRRITATFASNAEGSSRSQVLSSAADNVALLSDPGPHDVGFCSGMTRICTMLEHFARWMGAYGAVFAAFVAPSRHFGNLRYREDAIAPQQLNTANFRCINRDCASSPCYCRKMLCQLRR